jgi:hypothetical protein
LWICRPEGGEPETLNGAGTLVEHLRNRPTGTERF